MRHEFSFVVLVFFAFCCNPAVAQPDGTSMATAIPITGPVSGSTIGKTCVNHETNCKWGTYGVYYTWVAAQTMNDVTISLCGGGSDYDIMISILSGTPEAPVCVATDDDGCGVIPGPSVVTFNVVQGTRYWLLVTGFCGSLCSAGNYEITLTNFEAAPPEPTQPDPIPVVYQSHGDETVIEPGQCVTFNNTEEVDVVVHLETDGYKKKTFWLAPDNLSDCIQYNETGRYHYYGFLEKEYPASVQVRMAAKKSKDKPIKAKAKGKPGKPGKSKGKGKAEAEPDFSGDIIVEEGTTISTSQSSTIEPTSTTEDTLDDLGSKSKSEGKSHGKGKGGKSNFRQHQAHGPSVGSFTSGKYWIGVAGIASFGVALVVVLGVFVSWKQRASAEERRALLA